MTLRQFVRMEAVLILGIIVSGKAQTVSGGFDSPLDGQVNAIVVNSNKAYLGGTFTRIGYSCGTGVLLDTSTALPNRSFPKCDPLGGQILASVPDGMGGYYIGGQFLYINGVARNYLAHIRADYSLDSWNPSPNAYVTSLAVAGNRVYVGGVFSTIAGQSRGYAAAFDTGTGLILPWDPKANAQITAIQPVGNIVYLGGYFGSLNAQSRFIIASVDSSSGNVTVWNPINAGPSGSAHIMQFIYSGGYLYACGSFSKIDTVTRNTIIRMDGTGIVDLGWNPGNGINGGSATVMTMAISGNNLIVGGSFTTIGGGSHTNLAAIDLGTGIGTSWNPAPNNTVWSLCTMGGKVFVSGDFTSIGGRSINNLAKIDSGSGLASTWDSKLYNSPATSVPYTLSTDGTWLFAGGRFNGVGLTTRNGLAAIDLGTKQVTSWNPNVSLGGSNAVNALAVAGDKVIAGGNFTFIDGHSISYLAALDTTNGHVVLNPSWKATVNSSVYALGTVGDRLYIGGFFTSPRNGVEAVSKYDGALLPWNASLNSGVMSFANVGSKVFMGGFFTLVGATGRNNAAAFDTTNDSLTPWDPSPDNDPESMVAQGSTVYLGGSFFNVNSQSVHSVAAVDTANGSLIGGFNAGFTLSFDVYAMAIADTQLIIGGAWSTIGGQPRQSMAYLNATTGALSSWASNINNNVGSGTVRAIAVAPQTVYVGGQIASLSYFPQSNLAVVADPSIVVLPVEMASFKANVSGSIATLHWVTATQANNYGFEVERMTGDSRLWQKIGFVPGEGTTNNLRDYAFIDRGLPSGRYAYRIKQIDSNGGFKYSQVVEVLVSPVPTVLELQQNYPNPFNPSTQLRFSVAKTGKTTLEVYNIIGQRVAVLFEDLAQAGQSYSVTMNGSDFASGVYFVRLESGNSFAAKKMVLLR